MRFEHYAARFAAKKALFKALKIRPRKKLLLKNIEVRHEPTGKPYINLSSATRKALAFNAKDQIELSLAHEREYAVATVVIVKSKDQGK